MANTKVSVPKEAGSEVTISHGPDDSKTYRVTDGSVSVPEDQLDEFLARVDGSKVEGQQSTSGSPTARKE